MNPEDTIGNWKIIRRLRRFGHTGEVFVVQNKDNPRLIAALKHHLPDRPKTLPLFEKELQFLKDRPAPSVMPQLLDTGKNVDGSPYFVMEWVDPLPTDMPHDLLVKTIREIATACAVLRNAGFFHCDIKPSNVGRINGRLVLIDFGCVLSVNDSVQRRVAAGTDRFQAPEVELGLISERSELYSIAQTAVALADWKSRYRLSPARCEGSPALLRTPSPSPPK